MFINKRKITAAEEVEEEIKEEVEEEVEVAPEAEDILFEAEDVAELLAEVTDEVVEVNVDGDDVIFSVGEDEFTVTPDEDAEYVESSKRVSGRKINANRKIAKKSPVKSSKTVRKIRK